MQYNINPFDIMSGKIVQNYLGTFYFKEAGKNIDEKGDPIWGNLHRENDLPAIEWITGTKQWWYNGCRHRINGPAMEWHDGHKEWWLNDCLHRLDGPAIIRNNGAKEWFIDDAEYTEEDYNKKIKCMKK